MRNNAVTKYCRAVARAIPLRRKEKKTYIATLRAEADAVLSDAPDIQYDGLCSRLGTPQQQAEVFFDSFSPAEIQKLFRTRRTVLAITLSLAAIVFLGYWATILAVFINIAKSESHYETTITEIERGEVPENERILGGE